MTCGGTCGKLEWHRYLRAQCRNFGFKENRELIPILAGRVWGSSISKPTALSTLRQAVGMVHTHMSSPKNKYLA